ncbi:MAG: hypothetical protein ABS976_24505, partial [Rhodococcus sp. (in: high G+C Gram-positive bacteria)]
DRAHARPRVQVSSSTSTRSRNVCRVLGVSRVHAIRQSIALVALPYYRDTNEQITTWAKHAIAQVIDDIHSEL